MFHHEGEGDKDLEPSNDMVPGIDANPITCYPENNSLAERHFQSYKFEVSVWRYDANPSQPNVEPLNFLTVGKSAKLTKLRMKTVQIHLQQDQIQIILIM
jgi:hypothetical protein